jgi:uncharacterized protein YndB with AHSA1/START domain
MTTMPKTERLTAQAPLRLVIERTFDAPRDLVWRAWTRQEDLLQWFFAGECEMVFADADVRPGGAWRSAMKHAESGDVYTHRGEYREIDPPRRLVFTHAWEQQVPGTPCQTTLESVCTVTLTERGNQTHMTFEQVGFVSAESRDSHHGGWSGAFNHLAAYVARA